MTDDIELSLVLSRGWSVPLSARFTYRADDAYAVRLDFYLDTRKPVRWVFARELLTQGMVQPAGQADVRVWRTHDGSSMVSLRLVSSHGDALFLIRADRLTAWLDRTCELVPLGEEGRFADMDSLVAELLGRHGTDHG